MGHVDVEFGMMMRQITHDQNRAMTDLQITCEELGIDYQQALERVDAEAKASQRGWANACRLIHARIKREAKT